MPTKSRSSTTTELLPNPHPGEILLEEFLKPMGLSQTALANAIGVPPRRINEIVLGKRTVTADTDLRLARYFGVSEGFLPRPPDRPRPDGAPPADRRGAEGDQTAGGVRGAAPCGGAHESRRGLAGFFPAVALRPAASAARAHASISSGSSSRRSGTRQ